MLVDGDHDLLGDGSIELLLTPGHTPGHQSVRVGERLILGVDVGHFVATLDDLRFPAFADDFEAQADSARRLRERRDAGVRVLPGHVARADQHGGQDRAGDGEARADEERVLEARGERDGGVDAGLERSTVVELAIDARIARPSAPPTCWVVLIRPEARPASSGVMPVTAAIVTGHEREPEADAGEQRRPEHVAGKVPSTEICVNQSSAAAISSMPADQHGLEADPGHERRGDAGREDDADGQRQVGEAGLQRA